MVSNIGSFVYQGIGRFHIFISRFIDFVELFAVATSIGDYFGIFPQGLSDMEKRVFINL